MLLAVDAGNTNVVCALIEAGEIRTRWRIATDPRRTGDEYAVWLLQLLAIEGIAREAVTGMIVSTVVPRARHNLEVLGQKYFGLAPLFAGEGAAPWDFPLDVDEPRSLGSDRAINAMAAHARYPGDLIVIDFGTATTFDVVDFNGAYKGGIIAPGINLSLDALVNNTAKLPRIAIEAPRDASVIGRNTEDQMLIGAFWGYVAMMEGLIARITAEIGRPAKVIATGGSGEIGMNVNLYGCRGQWLMVDLGMSFGANEYPGTELLFADPEFIEERAAKLIGIVLTHAHEDHIGAVPYFAAELGVPLYATPFTAELVRRKLKEAGLEREIELNVIDREHGSLRLGPFEITYIPLAHSIAEGNALLIETPFGRVFHTGDWKLDDEPLVGTPATGEELTELGDEGILALVCDSTNVFNPAASGSEGAVYRGLLEEVRRHEGKRVLVTTFASNVARLQTLGHMARETGRALCVAGRSLDRIIEVAQASGYLQDFPETVDFDAAMALPRGKVMILATGGQGEPRAALARIAESQHPLSLTEGDVVLFSSRQIPGNELAIGRIQNLLAQRGIVMVGDRQSEIHVSGHPGRPELEAMYGWLRPEILVPVHGEVRHLQEQARLGIARGIPHAVFQKNGDIVRLAPGKPGKVAQVHAGRLVLDGDIIVPAGGEAITMRRRLARDGLVIVALDGRGGAQVHGIGLPLDEDYDAFVTEAERDVAESLRKLKGKRDPESVAEAARLAARRAAQRWSGKKPQVKVISARA